MDKGIRDVLNELICSNTDKDFIKDGCGVGIDKAISEIRKLVMNCIEKPKAYYYTEALNIKPGVNYAKGWAKHKIEGYNQAIADITKNLEEVFDRKTDEKDNNF